MARVAPVPLPQRLAKTAALVQALQGKTAAWGKSGRRPNAQLLVAPAQVPQARRTAALALTLTIRTVAILLRRALLAAQHHLLQQPLPLPPLGRLAPQPLLQLHGQVQRLRLQLRNAPALTATLLLVVPVAQSLLRRANLAQQSLLRQALPPPITTEVAAVAAVAATTMAIRMTKRLNSPASGSGRR